MKYFLAGCLFIGVLLSAKIFQDSGNEILQLYRSGKPLEIHKYFADKITVKILNQEDLLSRSQADAILRNFFDKNSFVSFTNSRLSGNPEQFQYITGTLITKNGEYRVSVLMKKNQIQQYRIESHD